MMIEFIEKLVSSPSKEEGHAKVGKKIYSKENEQQKENSFKKAGCKVSQPKKENQVEKSRPQETNINIAK